ALTITRAMRLSQGRPYRPDGQPMPPPRVRPATPVSASVPPGVARPKACVSWSNSPHLTPPSARTVRLAGATRMPFILGRSNTQPPFHTHLPRTLSPPPPPHLLSS